MTLARDEVVGLVIAGLVGGAAIASFGYRSLRAPASTVVTDAPVEVVDDQAARAAFAELLEAAFVQDQSPATVAADGVTLSIKWEMCSKQMLRRLLHDDAHYQVKNVRELTGISVAKLKSHGFKRVRCDDGRKGLEPAVVAL